MAGRQVALLSAVCLVALTAGCKGCAGPEEKAATEPNDPGSGVLNEDIGPVRGGVLPLGMSVIGQRDEADRYLSTFAFHVPSAPKGIYRLGCNSVLLSSQLVLTAAHCVCVPSRGETIRFDGSECATKAQVHVDYWDHSVDGGPLSGSQDDIDGDILIHPGFQIELDSQGGVATSRADLAVIRLVRPRPPGMKNEPVPLATEDVQAGEEVSVVGLGYTGTGHIGWRFRFFSREKVQTPAGEDRLLFDSVEDADYKGDTGGPCLRETKGGFELVGISQRGLGRTPGCTRIAPYRKWLEEQIQGASGRP